MRKFIEETSLETLELRLGFSMLQCNTSYWHSFPGTSNTTQQQQARERNSFETFQMEHSCTCIGEFKGFLSIGNIIEKKAIK